MIEKLLDMMECQLLVCFGFYGGGYIGRKQNEIMLFEETILGCNILRSRQRRGLFKVIEKEVLVV